MLVPEGVCSDARSDERDPLRVLFRAVRRLRNRFAIFVPIQQRHRWPDYLLIPHIDACHPCPKLESLALELFAVELGWHARFGVHAQAYEAKIPYLPGSNDRKPDGRFGSQALLRIYGL